MVNNFNGETTVNAVVSFVRRGGVKFVSVYHTMQDEGQLAAG